MPGRLGDEKDTCVTGRLYEEIFIKPSFTGDQPATLPRADITLLQGDHRGEWRAGAMVRVAQPNAMKGDYRPIVEQVLSERSGHGRHSGPLALPANMNDAHDRKPDALNGRIAC